MDKDVGTTLLYIFLAMLQIYIFFSVGIITGIKKIWSAKSIKSISELLINFFLPIYAILELARMSSWPNVEIMWILIISVFFAISLGFIIGKLLHHYFKLDERFNRSFPYLMSFPSLGTLPLVLGRALCYPGGMLEGDSNCSSILGYMMMNFLIFQMMLFVMGFVLMPKDANFSNSLMDKMSYIWHLLTPKIFDKNYSVYYIFKKFMKDDKTAKELFEVFNKKYKLEMIDNDNLAYLFTENNEIPLNFVLNHPRFQVHLKKSKSNFDVIDEESIHNDFEKNPIEDSYFNDLSKNEINFEIKNEIKIEIKDEQMNKLDTINQTDRNELLNTEIGLIPKSNNRENDECLLNKDLGLHKENTIDNIKEDVNDLPCDVDLPPEEFHFSKELNYVQSDYLADIEVHESRKKRMSKIEEKKILKKIDEKRRSSVNLFKNHVELYYQKLFGFVDLHLNEKMTEEYEEYKISIMNMIYGVPPRFPTVKYIPITREMVPVIEEEWIKFEKSVKKFLPEFYLSSTEIPISLSMIINKIHTPPIIGCFLGLLIGMSGMREVLFSSNHYISNLVDGISVITRSTVPFLYTILGISMLSIRGINFMNTPISKKYIYITFLLRFAILPCIGLLYVYLWKEYYGGIILASKVFRISIFIPFCLPATATVVVIVNIVKYFSDETGLILFIHNTTIVITLTIWYLIYYITIG